MIYADFEYYRDVFRGRLSEEEFLAQSAMASAIIDFSTDMRAEKAFSEFTKQIKDTCCHLVNALHNYGGAVTSVTNDGYSVTFAGDAEKRKTLREICVLGLYPTGLIYAGC